MTRRQPPITSHGDLAPAWSHEQRLRIAGPVLAAMVRRDTTQAEREQIAGEAWAWVKALEAASRRRTA